MSVYKLYAAFTTTADSLASLDVQFDGIITCVDWSVMADLDANAEAFEAEVSFLSSRTIGKNDARGSISSIAAQAAGAEAAGFAITQVNKPVSGLRIPVSAGERIHLHAELTTTADVKATVYLHVEDSADPRLRRRR